MEQQNMILTAKDRERFDSWSKEQIYEAYILEVQAKERLNIEVNRLGRKLAEIKFMAGDRG